MKDKAIQGLSEANTKNRLANDAEVAKRNKENVGRRNDYKSGLSKVSTSSASPFFNAQNNTTNTLVTNSKYKDKEAKKRLQQKRQQQALKIASMIPVINKYAKMAKTAQSVQTNQDKKSGFLGKKFGFGSKSNEETEQANENTSTSTTEQENKGLFSVTIPQSTLKKVGIGIAVGGFITLIFFCVILLAAITDSAGQSNLASKDNPTEEEYEQQYQTNEDNESNNSEEENSSDEGSEENETGYLDNLSTVEFVNETSRYNSEDLSDYFGTKQACTNDGKENDCRNGNEYKFYLKMYDIYYLYKNKYNVKLDLPLIMATLYYNNEQLPTVFSENLNSYDRALLKDKSQITNLDWEYDYKKDPCYTYLNANDFSYDMQILAKNMVTKKITYKCTNGTSHEVVDIEISNYSDETLKCDSGSYDKNSIKASYELDLDKYDKFLLEYIKLKYHTKGTPKKSCSVNNSSNESNTTISKTGKEAIDKMTEIALAEEGNGGSKYRSWYYGYDNGVDWCAVFTSWLFNQVGGLDKYIVQSAGAGDIPRYSTKEGYGTWYEDECTDSTTVPKAGDVILFDPWFNGSYVSYPNHSNDKYYSSHVGYVYKVDDSYVYTVEGNSNDKVAVNKYSRKKCGSGVGQGINGYFRPNY